MYEMVVYISKAHRNLHRNICLEKRQGQKNLRMCQILMILSFFVWNPKFLRFPKCNQIRNFRGGRSVCEVHAGENVWRLRFFALFCTRIFNGSNCISPRLCLGHGIFIFSWFLVTMPQKMDMDLLSPFASIL